MNKIAELKKEIARLEHKNKSFLEMQKLTQEKARLEEEYKRLSVVQSQRQQTISKVGKGLKDVGSKLLSLANEGRRNLEAKEKQGGLGFF